MGRAFRRLIFEGYGLAWLRVFSHTAARAEARPRHKAPDRLQWRSIDWPPPFEHSAYFAGIRIDRAHPQAFIDLSRPHSHECAAYAKGHTLPAIKSMGAPNPVSRCPRAFSASRWSPHSDCERPYAPILFGCGGGSDQRIRQRQKKTIRR